ncbi:MAG: serine/threonine protein kinase [Candidatus Wallbacteria bacterium]|nr:serine/threonine protein kinase [Candidatus Wallbacteria bacterium]
MAADPERDPAPSRSGGRATVTGPGRRSESGGKTYVSSTKHSAAARRSAAPSEVVAERYEVRGMAGEGGMGEVLVVRDRVLERDIALKRMLGEDRSDERLRRFMHEARVTGRLEHPGIVPVHDLTPHEGHPFFTMKLVKGASLGQAIAGLRAGSSDGPDLRRLVGILVSVCQAMAFAHSRGVLHRDLKPDNIMLGDFGEVLVMDWGLARADAREETSQAPSAPAETRPVTSGIRSGVRAQAGLGTMEGSIAGTPGYMAPEQARGEISRLSERTDVYALGAILYECLTLQPPHQKETSLLTLQAVLTEPIVAPSRRATGRHISPDLEAIAMKALDPQPGRRYASVNAFREDLEAWLGDQPVGARRSTPLESFLRWTRRHRERALGIFLGLAAAVTGAGAHYGHQLLTEHRQMGADEAKRAALAAILAQAEQEQQALAGSKPMTSGRPAALSMPTAAAKPVATPVAPPPPPAPSAAPSSLTGKQVNRVAATGAVPPRRDGAAPKESQPEADAIKKTGAAAEGGPAARDKGPDGGGTRADDASKDALDAVPAAEIAPDSQDEPASELDAAKPAAPMVGQATSEERRRESKLEGLAPSQTESDGPGAIGSTGGGAALTDRPQAGTGGARPEQQAFQAVAARQAAPPSAGAAGRAAAAEQPAAQPSPGPTTEQSANADSEPEVVLGGPAPRFSERRQALRSLYETMLRMDPAHDQARKSLAELCLSEARDLCSSGKKSHIASLVTSAAQLYPSMADECAAVRKAAGLE